MKKLNKFFIFYIGSTVENERMQENSLTHLHLHLQLHSEFYVGFMPSFVRTSSVSC